MKNIQRFLTKQKVELCSCLIEKKLEQGHKIALNDNHKIRKEKCTTLFSFSCNTEKKQQNSPSLFTHTKQKQFEELLCVLTVGFSVLVQQQHRLMSP